MGGTCFRILGPVEVWLDRRRLPIGGPRQVALLSYLLLRSHEAVSEDDLRDALWEAEYRDGSDKRLQMAVHRLRTALAPIRGEGEPILRTVAGGYLLAPPEGSLDADVFTRAVAEARAALGTGRPEAAERRLKEVWDIWRGPPLADIRLHDFAQPEIRRLEELRLAAHELRVDAALQLGREVTVLSELQALVDRHPTRERLAGQLMLAQYRSGRQAEALETYGRARAVLAADLGVAPGPALKQLHTEILQHAPAAGGASNSTSRIVPDGIVTMLFTDIDGSTRLLQQLGDLYGDVLNEHLEIVRDACSRHAGVEIDTTGDGVFVAFRSARAALEAAREMRDTLALTPWPQGVVVAARIGVHTGEPRVRAGNYWGEDVHYAARVCQAGHGGQVLVSAATASLVPDDDLIDLGDHRLKDFAVPKRLFQLGSEAHPPLRTPDPLRSNLPSSAGPLIGRESECAAVLEMLRLDGRRLVSITGGGGTGKTRLALAVANALVRDLTGGAFFIPLGEVSSVDQVPAAIAAPLGIRLPLESDGGEALAVALGNRRLLLVLDNVEHLPEAGRLIVALLAIASGVQVLTTTQVPLHVRGEHVMQLGALDVPQTDSPAAVHSAAAGQLMVERIRELTPGFALTPETAHHIARLCRVLNGLPLAIELAASRLAAIPAGALVIRVQESIDALGRGSRDLPARQQGLRAALEWTHELLGDDEATMLRRLGAFAGPASLERIEQVCGDGIDVLEALARLVDFSLVNRTGDGSFYLHGSTRAYARERLAAAGETDAMRRRHAHAFATAADGWGRHFLLDVDAVESVVAREEADVAEALTWAVAHDLESFARLAGGAALPLVLRSRLLHLRPLIEVALAGEIASQVARAWLLLAGSLAAWQAGEADDAQARIRAAQVAAEASGDSWLACLAGTCSILNGIMGDPQDEIRGEYAMLRRRVAELGDDRFTALVDGIEASLLSAEGRVDDARPLFAELMQASWRSDFAARTAVYEWPDCLMAAGDHEAALSAYLQALRAAQARVEAQNIAYQLEGIAMALSALSRHDQALETYGSADSLRQTAGPIVSASWKGQLADAMDRSRAAVPPDRAARMYAAGRTRSVDAAVAAALRLERAELSPVAP